MMSGGINNPKIATLEFVADFLNELLDSKGSGLTSNLKNYKDE